MKCIVPWTQLNVRTDGSIQVCPFSPLRITDKGRQVSLRTDEASKIFNSSRLREIRLAMLKGEELPECERCRQDEKIGAVSKRLLSNREYPEYANRWDRTGEDGSVLDPPILLNLPMGNLCNNQCRMCNPKFSSRIAASMFAPAADPRWKAFVPKGDIKKAGNLGDYLSGFDYLPEAIPQVLEMLPGLQYIYLHGGEPTINPHFDQLIQHILRENLHQKISFGMTTNLSSDRWFNYFKDPWLSCLIYFSFDGVGKVHEYVRYPSNWSRFETNLKALLKSKNIISRPCITLSALNVTNFPEMIRYLDDIYSAHGLALNFRINLLSSPRHLRIEALPQAYREKLLEKISAMRISELKSVSPSADGREVLERNISAMMTRLSSPEECVEDFFTYNQSLDANYAQRLEDIMPGLKEN